jgi:PAS domain S-box-containing protein
MGIYKVTLKAENALFSFLCLLWSAISAAYLSKFFASGKDTVFLIEQISHFSFAFYPFIHIVYFHKLLKIRERIVTFLSFILSTVFSIGVFTPAYMNGMYEYSWGYIAKAGPLLYIFLVYCAITVSYVMYIVLKEVNRESNLIRRIKYRYILFSMVIAAVLTMLTAVPMSGYDLYLPANFVFIPMGFLGYGLLRYRILGIRTILHMSLLWLFSSLLVMIPNALVFAFAWPVIYRLSPPMMFGFLVFWFFINFHFVIRLQPYINMVFDKNSHDLKKSGLSFFESMLLLRNTPELVNEFKNVVKKGLGFNDVHFYLSTDDGFFENEEGAVIHVSPALTEWLKKAVRPVEVHMVETDAIPNGIKTELLSVFKERRTQFIVPMAQYGSLLALALLHDTSPDRLLNKGEARFIDQMGGFVSIALFNSRVFQSMTQLKDKLEEKTLNLSQEVAERRKAEAEAREGWARYKLLAENVIDTIWVLRVSDLKILYISPSVEKLNGFTVKEMVDKELDTMLTPESYEYVLKIQANLLSGDRLNTGETISMELEHIRKDGTRVWVEVSAHMMTDERWPGCIIGVSRNISERKKAETEKKVLEARLMQAQKMESIGVLAGGIAHDFNNILMSILGYTQLARLYVPDDNTAAHEKLARIEKASFRAKDMVSQILAFSRQSEPDILPVQMGPIILEALKLLKSSLPSTLSIVTDFKDNLRSVLADPVQIHQVVINLCSNAAHAMEDQGGTIRVSLTDTAVDPKEALLMNLAPGHYIRLSVSDTGCGMDPKTMEKIFDPYFTTKEVGKGSGMGLAVVHGIVMGCGGKITVRSELGKGSTFELLFPTSESIVLSDSDPSDRYLNGQERDRKSVV